MNILILGTSILAINPQDTGDQWETADQIIPKHVAAGAVIVDVTLPDDYAPGKYRYDGGFVRIPEVLPPLADYVTAMEALYDAKAAERRYDNRLTCALRAGYAGPFQAEGAAFAIWMDNCNALGYTTMGKVVAGIIPQPTIAAFLDTFPPLVWPA